MFLTRWACAALLGCGMLATAGCTDGYGYSGVSVGYGNGGYYGDPYYADGGWGGGFAPSYYGWYGDYYYPGTGGFVYDRYRRPVRWNADQQRYWQGRRGAWGNRQVRSNWQDFRRDVRRERQDYREDVRSGREAYRAGTIDRGQFRDMRRDARREYRQDVRRDYRDLRRDNRAQGYRPPRPDRAFRPRRDR